jgi:hypothetical protein
MTIVDANPLVLVLKNFKKRIPIEVRLDDDDNTLVEATELDLQVQDLGDNVEYTDSFTDPPPAGTRIKNPSTGMYYIVWGDPSAPANTPDQSETDILGKHLFVWSVVGPAGTEEVQRVQTVETISALTMDCIREFRGQIDKTNKDVSVDPEDFCPLGYTDGWLLEYLRGGLHLMNAYQPYPVWSSLHSFLTGKGGFFKQTLFDAGMIVGINAQTLFAVDSDIEQWSDQGNAFVINHQPKLAAFNAALSQRLDKIIPQMKLHFVNSGSIKTEMGPNFRLSTLVQMSPNGATFRNLFTRG